MENERLEFKEVYQLKDGFLYKKPENEYNFENKYLINGESPRKTFKDNFYFIESKIESVKKKGTIKINERWELKNKNLYNEKIPMIIDESTKDLFQELLTEELYLYTFEEKEIEEEVVFNLHVTLIEANDDFNNFEIVRKYESWFGEYKESKKYFINDLVYSLKDNCLTPSPIKELTKPCVLPSEKLYQIIVDYIKRNINSQISNISSDYDFTFTVKDVRTGKAIFFVNNKNGCSSRDYSSNNFQDLVAKNYSEMIKKVDKIKKNIINHINYDEKAELEGFVYLKNCFDISNIGG